jgi:hypothetical protein
LSPNHVLFSSSFSNGTFESPCYFHPFILIYLFNNYTTIHFNKIWKGDVIMKKVMLLIPYSNIIPFSNSETWISIAWAPRILFIGAGGGDRKLTTNLRLSRWRLPLIMALEHLGRKNNCFFKQSLNRWY